MRKTFQGNKIRNYEIETFVYPKINVVQPQRGLFRNITKSYKKLDAASDDDDDDDA